VKNTFGMPVYPKSTPLLRIRVVPVSNIGLETKYSEVFRGFALSVQANAGIVP
jgi:hypothetical protein